MLTSIRENITRTTAYVSAIEEAEQFLWAGSEMDLVREMHNSLVQARKWAKSVRNCVSKLKTWSNNPRCDSERVQMNHVNELLKFSTPPCNEPRHIRLKEYKEEASKMIQEINSALTSCSEFSLGDLEILYVKAVDLPIHIKEIEQLNLKLSAVKLPARQEPVLDSSKYTAADVRIRCLGVSLDLQGLILQPLR